MYSGKVIFSDKKYSKSSEKLQPFKIKMIELITANEGGLCLDVGCGTGVISRMLREAAWDVIGLDISPQGIEKYCKRGFKGLISDVEHGLPFKGQSFDAVWISEVIEHIVEYQSLIREIGRVLKQSGRVYISTPNSVFYGYRLMYLMGKCPSELQHPYHLRFFSPKYLCNILEKNGFKVEKCLGQNIYLGIPASFLIAAERVSKAFAEKIVRWLHSLGFKKVEGLVHGDKYLFYKFSFFHPEFFSNAIIIVASNAK
jgi:ubiquinone/menaquinone biosynthesis C-methylase UbiE